MSENILRPHVLLDSGEWEPVCRPIRMSVEESTETNRELYKQGSKYVWLEVGEA